MIRVTTPILPDFIDPRPQGRISCSNDPWQGNFIPMGKSENFRSIEIRTHSLSTCEPQAYHSDVIHLPLVKDFRCFRKHRPHKGKKVVADTEIKARTGQSERATSAIRRKFTRCPWATKKGVLERGSGPEKGFTAPIIVHGKLPS